MAKIVKKPPKYICPICYRSLDKQQYITVHGIQHAICPKCNNRVGWLTINPDYMVWQERQKHGKEKDNFYRGY